MVAGNTSGRTIYIDIVADATRLLAGDAAGEAAGESAEGEAVTDPAGADVKAVQPGSRFISASAAAPSARRAAGKLVLDLDAGDTIRFSAKSGSNNFEEAALIEDIGPIGGCDTLQNFALVNEERGAVAPRDYDRVLPARSSQREFWFWQCEAATDGAPHCSVLLAVYDRDEQGQPRLAGRYRWTLQLTVRLTSTTSPTHQGETS